MARDEVSVESVDERVILFPERTIEATERSISATGEKISSSTSVRIGTRRGVRSNPLLLTIQPSTLVGLSCIASRHLAFLNPCNIQLAS